MAGHTQYSVLQTRSVLFEVGPFARTDITCTIGVTPCVIELTGAGLSERDSALVAPDFYLPTGAITDCDVRDGSGAQRRARTPTTAAGPRPGRSRAGSPHQAPQPALFWHH